MYAKHLKPHLANSSLGCCEPQSHRVGSGLTPRFAGSELWCTFPRIGPPTTASLSSQTSHSLARPHPPVSLPASSRSFVCTMGQGGPS